MNLSVANQNLGTGLCLLQPPYCACSCKPPKQYETEFKCPWKCWICIKHGIVCIKVLHNIKSRESMSLHAALLNSQYTSVNFNTLCRHLSAAKARGWVLLRLMFLYDSYFMSSIHLCLRHCSPLLFIHSSQLNKTKTLQVIADGVALWHRCVSW